LQLIHVGSTQNLGFLPEIISLSVLNYSVEKWQGGLYAVGVEQGVFVVPVAKTQTRNCYKLTLGYLYSMCLIYTQC